MVISYTRPFEDENYNPLPRDVVVRDNVYGTGGSDPSFPGGKELAAAFGGAIPPILLDGADTYEVGGETRSEPVRIVFDAPGITMGIDRAGQDRMTGTIAPAVSYDGEIPEPSPVVLPANQPGMDDRPTQIAAAD
jgi:hypothetical protein